MIILQDKIKISKLVFKGILFYYRSDLEQEVLEYINNEKLFRLGLICSAIIDTRTNTVLKMRDSLTEILDNYYGVNENEN